MCLLVTFQFHDIVSTLQNSKGKALWFMISLMRNHFLITWPCLAHYKHFISDVTLKLVDRSLRYLPSKIVKLSLQCLFCRCVTLGSESAHFDLTFY